MYRSTKAIPYQIILVLMACLIFSYAPVITLGTFSGLHVDISLLYILCCAVAVTNITPILTHYRSLLAAPAAILLSITILYIAFTILWSANTGRAVITSSFFALMAIIACAVAVHRRSLNRYKKHLFQVLTAAGLLIASMAILQIVTDMLGITSPLLPEMYNGDVFGIARPTGFSLEPQFLASILLIPFGYLGMAVARYQAQKRDYFLFILVTALLILTLSRGAIVGMAVIFIVTIAVHHSSIRTIATYLFTGIVSLMIATVVIYSTASIRHDDISGTQAVKRVAEHLSLGLIKPQTAQPAIKVSTDTSPSLTKTAPLQSGYVASSTESRLSASDQALNIWLSSPSTLLFGVGIGSFGTHLSPPSSGAVVNNYYMELLVETGLIGIILFLSTLCLLFNNLIKQKQWTICAILAGLLAQMYFFSGNANIIHVWVMIGLALSFTITKKQSRKP